MSLGHDKPSKVTDSSPSVDQNPIMAEWVKELRSFKEISKFKPKNKQTKDDSSILLSNESGELKNLELTNAELKILKELVDLYKETRPPVGFRSLTFKVWELIAKGFNKMCSPNRSGVFLKKCWGQKKTSMKSISTPTPKYDPTPDRVEIEEDPLPISSNCHHFNEELLGVLPRNNFKFEDTEIYTGRATKPPIFSAKISNPWNPLLSGSKIFGARFHLNGKFSNKVVLLRNNTREQKENHATFKTSRMQIFNQNQREFGLLRNSVLANNNLSFRPILPKVKLC